MDNQKFYETVKNMRSAQKKFFKTHDLNVLMESRELEKQVDAMIDAREEEKEGGSLFPQEG